MNQLKSANTLMLISIVLFSFYREPNLATSFIVLSLCAVSSFQTYLSTVSKKPETKEPSEIDTLRQEYETEQIKYNIQKIKSQKIVEDLSNNKNKQKIKMTW